jgi:parvulin-like peptidyl-prolyl isomerase
MREWFLKWEKVIIWIVAIVFIGGMLWWSVAEYAGMGQQSSNTTNNTYTPNRDEATVILTKDGTDLKYDYWVFSSELSTTLQQLMAYYKQMGMDPDELFDEPYVELNAARSLVDGKIATYYAAETGISPSSQEVEAEIQKIVDENITTEEIKQAVIYRYGSIDGYKDIIREPVKTQLTKDKVNAIVSQATEEQYQKYYEENIESLKTEGNKVKASHILVDTEEKANELIGKIKAQEITFTQAASENSLDDGTKDKGGELGWFGKNEMVAEFEQAAFSAEPGTLVGPVKTDYGYHIIQVEEKKTLSSYEEFKNQSDLLETAKTAIEKENYDKWLADYKAKEKIAYVINDNVLQTLDQYVNETNESEDVAATIAFRKKLEPYIVMESEGKTVWAQDVDPRISALFLKILETESENLGKEKSLYERYLLLKNSLNPQLAELTKEQVQEGIKAFDKQLEGLSEGATRTQLLTQKLEYKDVEEYLEKKEEIVSTGKDPQDINTLIETVQARISANDTLIVMGYKELYNYNTSSKTVINKLYEFMPDDPQIALRYHQTTLNDYLPYLQNKSIFEQYRSYLEPQFLQIEQSLANIARDASIPEDTRVAAYESILSLMEAWERFEEEVTYLEELKILKPSYPDIDLIIKQVKEAIEMAKIELEEALKNATDTTSNASAVQ